MAFIGIRFLGLPLIGYEPPRSKTKEVADLFRAFAVPIIAITILIIVLVAVYLYFRRGR
jgi:hypothetical protein